jgi:hypothetical protein
MAKQTLTDKQENFAIAYTINGNNATKAYKECYDVGENTTDGSIWVNAHKVLHNDKVALRIAELREQRFSKKILSIEERKILLSEWANDGDSKSLDLLNKMEGVYVEKVEHSGQIIKRVIKVNPTKG